MFTLTHENGATDGRLLYLPNNLYHALESDPVEDVSFLHDEGANLVWAIEHRYEVEPGDVRNRHDEETTRMVRRAKPENYWDAEKGIIVRRSEIEGEGEPRNRFVGPVAVYEPQTYPPEHWIPYKPRQKGSHGGFMFRRARTKEDLSSGPQYKGVLLAESKNIFEEKVPRVGIRLSRLYQLARDIDRQTYLWCSRKKKSDTPRKSSELHFDSLIDH